MPRSRLAETGFDILVPRDAEGLAATVKLHPIRAYWTIPQLKRAFFKSTPSADAKVRLKDRMDKAFVVEEGHEVRCGYVWHPPGLLVLVEPHQSVEIYATIDGRRGARVGIYPHESLDPADLPQGLTLCKGE